MPISISSDFTFVFSMVFSISSWEVVAHEVVVQIKNRIAAKWRWWQRFFMARPVWVILFSNTNSFQESLFYGDKWVTLGVS